MENSERLHINPGGLAFTKAVVEIESTFHPLEQRYTFKVTNRHAVLKDHGGVISAQRQTPFRGHTHDVKLNPATDSGLQHSGRITIGKAVEFSIAKRRSFARHIQNLFALGG